MTSSLEDERPRGDDSSAEIELSEMPLRRKVHPVLGPGIFSFGALLWAFVVAGEFTTAGFVGESIAVVSVIGVTCGAAALAMRACSEDSLRRLGLLTHVVLAALVAVSTAVFTAIALGLGLHSSYGNLDIPITLFLLLLSGIAFAWGKRLTARPLRWPPSRTLRLALCGIAVILSFGAVVHVIAAN